MFSNKCHIMLYVPDVEAEKNFWQAAGFSILSEGELMDSKTFDMAISPEATTIFSVMDLNTIRQISPEVADNQPSILFHSNDLESLHQTIEKIAPVCNPITDLPFKHFNFASPSGQYYAVAQA